MALKFQYNKTYLQQLNKELKIRLNALPTLEAKESALRLEVKKARVELNALEEKLKSEYDLQSKNHRLWTELPDNIIKVKEVIVDVKKIAGVKTPILQDVKFEVQRYSAFSMASWVPTGIEILKKLVHLKIEVELAKKKVDILEHARKKTTQKVNLYEKVQIPEYMEAIRKIKRFLEDEDNLAKSAQKILKAKIAASEAA
ncbi:MAG: V-type ATP synthase subunit D [Chitinispirillaceae bacterium]|nr:V-type ATP synthase subunit D [Chitinispirillaceae bacterium]